jgi:alkaline phosphatase D
MKLQLFALVSSVSIVTANWARNINYRSPSEHHPGLGIAIHKVVKRNDPRNSYEPSQLKFTHGVASGDPWPHSVILWTRAAPTSDNDHSNVTVSGTVPLYNHDTEEYVAASKSPVCVQWKIASDKKLQHVVDSGKVFTSSDIDYTIKVCPSSNIWTGDRL